MPPMPRRFRGGAPWGYSIPSLFQCSRGTGESAAMCRHREGFGPLLAGSPLDLILRRVPPVVAGFGPVHPQPPDTTSRTCSSYRVVRFRPRRPPLQAAGASARLRLSTGKIVTHYIAHRPKGGFVSWLHPLCFLHGRNPSYGAPDSSPVGLPPTEPASLRWTHSVVKTCVKS